MLAYFVVGVVLHLGHERVSEVCRRTAAVFAEFGRFASDCMRNLVNSPESLFRFH
jgi:hypothetical protein